MTHARNLHLSIDAYGGIPLPVAAFLLRALGTAYPGTQLDTSGLSRAVMSLRIPAADLYSADTDEDEDDDTDEDATTEEWVADKDDPELVAFLNGFRDGSFSVSPPPWLSALLNHAARELVDALPGAAQNYLSLELHPREGHPFYWIICRPGAESPHALRTKAEQRVAALEQQLRDAGIEPCTDASDMAGRA